jgi:tetratricopeptide (TPR) repeat protein
MSVDARADAVLPLEEIVARDPATALYLPLAERLTMQGRLDDAVRLCEERRNRPGRGVGDHVVLGRAYLAMGRLGEARAEFAAALALDRENVVALKALGGILSHDGHHEEAAGYYRAVCRVDPGDLESQTALHQITSGEYPEARPADVIVAQGGLTWQPIRLPREEEHLSELALGLRTIESFVPAQDAPAAPVAPVAPEAPEPPAEPVSAAPRVAPVEKLPPVEMPAPKPGRMVEGNRAAFETWLRQLGGPEGGS